MSQLSSSIAPAESPRRRSESASTAKSRSQREPWRALDHVQAALVGMQFGQVTVIVQDGLIVQVERTEKTRIGRS